MSEWWSDAVHPDPEIRLSSWPQVTEYIDAVESMAFADDSPLVGMRPVHGGFLGGPIVLSGRSAVVFCLEAADGSHHALRLFMAPPSPNLPSICELSTYQHVPFPHTTWVERAVLSGDEWWPALVMPWCDGAPLDLWLSRHQDESVETVATSIIEHVSRLAGLGIVHGDLQHGNILVAEDGEITFVDLDGVVLCDPTTGLLLPGWSAPTEAGHPNYQHPERTLRSIWTPSVDVFSALVIDVAIRAVAIEPKLLEKYYVEDNLLMVASDLAQPDHSEVFARLRELGDEAVNVRCDQLSAFSALTIEGMRPTRAILFDGVPPTGAPYSQPWYTAVPLHEVASDWEAAEAEFPDLDALALAANDDFDFDLDGDPELDDERADGSPGPRISLTFILVIVLMTAIITIGTLILTGR